MEERVRSFIDAGSLTGKVVGQQNAILLTWSAVVGADMIHQRQCVIVTITPYSDAGLLIAEASLPSPLPEGNTESLQKGTAASFAIPVSFFFRRTLNSFSSGV